MATAKKESTVKKATATKKTIKKVQKKEEKQLIN